jgi:hypothetical protein
MNWAKTFESFLYEADEIDAVGEFEDAIKLPKGSGIITKVEYDASKKNLVIDLLPKLGSFDTGSLLGAIDKSKAALKKKYSGVKMITAGSTIINI